MPRSPTLALIAGAALVLGACAAQAPAPDPQAVLQANMQKLAEADQKVNAECFGKLQRREIPSNRSYVECYAAKMRPNYQAFEPENLDLLDSLAKQWGAVAEQVDTGKMRAADATTEMARIKGEIEVEAQRRADAAARTVVDSGEVEGTSGQAEQNRRKFEQGLHQKNAPPTAPGGGARPGG